MSNKSHRLQRKAAAMFVAGQHDYDIITACGIREYTLSRWKNSAIFLEEVERLQEQQHNNRPLRIQRLMEEFIDAATRTMKMDHSNPKNLSLVLDIAQQIEKDCFFMSNASHYAVLKAKDRARIAQKSFQTIPKTFPTVPESFPIVPHEAENDLYYD